MTSPSIPELPILKRYDQDHLRHIALPLGGIGTGTISLGGRGDLRDWELTNRPAKGYTPAPSSGGRAPFFALWVKDASGKTITRALEGVIDPGDYEGSHGCTVPNAGLPRFRDCEFSSAYPFGQVWLSDADMPVSARLDAFNPLVPADSDASGIPTAVLRYVITNQGDVPLHIAVVGSLPNFIGANPELPSRTRDNLNEYRQADGLKGVYLSSTGANPKAEEWGSLCLATTTQGKVTYRTAWLADFSPWSMALLDFWDDFSANGELEERPLEFQSAPTASLAVKLDLPAHGTASVTFLLTWHFPNHYSWTPQACDCKDGCDCQAGNRTGNYYTTRYTDAWDAAVQTAVSLDELEAKTLDFVRSFCSSDLPDEVKEAALFNLSTLRSQTCFRTPDGNFYGWEGCFDRDGCCMGSCTHVWNYEQATAFLFGKLALRMRTVEFGQSTDENGRMSFRVSLPLTQGRDFAYAAADGQLGCIMKLYRDWQLSGSDSLLRSLWENAKKALAFCWIEGGWDADQDGVMEGVQHNTMDVEYFGPNPQMQGWYLGALRSAEEMALHLGDAEFAQHCANLFEYGTRWMDENLFNGDYYEHQVRPLPENCSIADGLVVGMGARDPQHPDFQLASGCLVDQLVGQYMAHICGLGYLHNPQNIAQTLRSILKYNQLSDFYNHFNNMRSFVLGGERALLMASYPKGRPSFPFPYFGEVMTGFEYTAAVGMIYEGMVEEGLGCIRDIRARYDGLKRSPFDEAECGHHYARAMASWAAVLALSGFQYSGVQKRMGFAGREGNHFWSNGYAWGTCHVETSAQGFHARLEIRFGKLELETFQLAGCPDVHFDPPLRLKAGESRTIPVSR
jgi:non-lysosomal glucosylceramidase